MKQKNAILDFNTEFVTIQLTQAKTTTVDIADFQRVSQHRWCAWLNTTSGKWYVTGTVAGKTVYLHRWLCGTPRGLDTDHVDGDSLNNRRISNLRIATRTQNQANRPIPKNNTSGAKGVSLMKSGRFHSKLTIGGTNVNLGTHDTAELAGMAYDTAANTLFGAFARLNFPAPIAIPAALPLAVSATA